MNKLVLLVLAMSTQAHAFPDCSKINLVGRWHNEVENKVTDVEFCSNNGSLHRDDAAELCVNGNSMNFTISSTAKLDAKSCTLDQTILSASQNLNGGAENKIQINAPKSRLKVVDYKTYQDGSRLLVLAPCRNAPKRTEENKTTGEKKVIEDTACTDVNYNLIEMYRAQ